MKETGRPILSPVVMVQRERERDRTKGISNGFLSSSYGVVAEAISCLGVLT
jgi:hypothetical protein